MTCLKIFHQFYPHGTRLQNCVKNFETKMLKFEAGQFKNQFLPCFFRASGGHPQYRQKRRTQDRHNNNPLHLSAGDQFI
jgi:hypothetical protein